MRRFLFSVLMVCSLLAVPLAEATERSSDEVSRIMRQVSQEVYSPYCPGKTLAMCPSAQALNTRMEVQEWAREGMSADEIKAVLFDRYGQEYELVEPSTRDNALLLGGILGGMVVAVFLVGFVLTRGHLRTRDDDEDSGADDDGPDDDGEGPDGSDGYIDDLRAQVRD